jgi:O-antigen ligase
VGRHHVDFAGERPEVAAVNSEVVSGDEDAMLPTSASTPPTTTSARSRPPIELFAAAVAFLISIAFAPSSVEAGAFTARAAILLVVLAVGLPILLTQTRQPRPLAARAAVAFLLIGFVSAVRSANHTTAVFGLYAQGTGLLYMASLAGAWAVGRSIRPKARPRVERALIFGVLVNVGVALLAAVIDLSSLGAGLVDSSGRAQALTGNPVLLGALAGFGLALLVPRFATAPATWGIPVVATVAAAQLSGTRVALVVIAGIVLWAVRRHGVRVGATLALLVIIGLAGGHALSSPGAASATGRAVQTSDDWRVRPATWVSAGHSLVRRSLFGIGPGQFRTATSPYRPHSVGRLEGPEKIFTDAHNLVVEYATTTGLLGVGALIIWLLAAMRGARDCLFAGALALLAVHMFEPQSVLTTPLLFLALGAGGSVGTRSKGDRPAVHWIITSCCIAASIWAAAILLVGEFDLRQSELDFTLAPVSQANRILPAWPRPEALLAKVWLFDGIAGANKADIRQSRSWQLRALQRDDTDPQLWNDLADFDASEGSNAAASAEYLSALRFNPTSVRAMDGLARLARSRCDPSAERYWRQRSLQVVPPVTAPLPGSGGLTPQPPNCAVPRQK